MTRLEFTWTLWYRPLSLPSLEGCSLSLLLHEGRNRILASGCMDCQLTCRLLSKDRVAVTFARAVRGEEGLSQCPMMRGEKRSQITLSSLLCWDVSLDKQQDPLVG